MPLEDLRQRAKSGDLTPDEIALVRQHLHEHQPEPVRRAALTIASDYLEQHSDAALMFDLIRLSEDEAPENEHIRTDVVRALARATNYRGRPVQFDL